MALVPQQVLGQEVVIVMVNFRDHTVSHKVQDLESQVVGANLLEVEVGVAEDKLETAEICSQKYFEPYLDMKSISIYVFITYFLQHA